MQHGVDAGDELVEHERLRDVVVATAPEALEHVAAGRARRQEDDRRLLAVRAQPPAHLEAVEAGHQHVEHDDVRRRRGDLGQRVGTVDRDARLEAGVAQRGADHVADGVVVVDDQHVRSHRRTVESRQPQSNLRARAGGARS